MYYRYMWHVDSIITIVFCFVQNFRSYVSITWRFCTICSTMWTTGTVGSVVKDRRSRSYLWSSSRRIPPRHTSWWVWWRSALRWLRWPGRLSIQLISLCSIVLLRVRWTVKRFIVGTVTVWSLSLSLYIYILTPIGCEVGPFQGRGQSRWESI